MDLFMELAAMHIQKINDDLQTIFNLIYSNKIPDKIPQLFTGTYLFLLYKDPNDLTELRPLGISTALRKIIASHMAKQSDTSFAQRLFPFNFCVRVKGGMDFIIRIMQLTVKKFIT